MNKYFHRPMAVFYALGVISASIVIYIILVFSGTMQAPWTPNDISGYWTTSDYIYLIDDNDGDLFVRCTWNPIGELKVGSLTNKISLKDSQFKGRGMRDHSIVTFRCSSSSGNNFSFSSHSQEVRAKLSRNNRLTGVVHTWRSYRTYGSTNILGVTSAENSSSSTTNTFYAVKRGDKEIQQWLDE
jgi:hypothetical protein